MKKLMFLVAASLFVFAACSSEDDSSPEVNPENAAITFELSAVNGLTDGIGTRMPVYSQEATQHVTRVSVYAFVQNGSTYLHQRLMISPAGPMVLPLNVSLFPMRINFLSAYISFWP